MRKLKYMSENAERRRHIRNMKWRAKQGFLKRSSGATNSESPDMDRDDRANDIAAVRTALKKNPKGPDADLYRNATNQVKRPAGPGGSGVRRKEYHEESVKPLTLDVMLSEVKRLSKGTLENLRDDAKRKIAGGYDPGEVGGMIRGNADRLRGRKDRVISVRRRDPEHKPPKFTGTYVPFQ